LPRERSQPVPTLEDILLGQEPVDEDDHQIILAEEPYSKGEPGRFAKIEETDFEKEYNLRGITSIEEMDKQFGKWDSQITDEDQDEVDVEDDEGEDKNEWRKKFDLKQAVVFSEILNRPYA
jgi:hypothetical protein